jgi:hypothetical protein
MPDIADSIPKTSATTEAIYSLYEDRRKAEPDRAYLGASIIGHECDRFLWLAFRGAFRQNFPGRILRLFDTGKREEARIIEELRGIGVTVEGEDPQISIQACGGHFRGHLDGMGLGIPEAPKTWHVLEFKTHNSKSFAKLEKEGVQKSKPMHYAQMQVYMGCTATTRALYVAVNKDTDDIYTERVRYDLDAFARLMRRAQDIIAAITPPPRCADRPDDFRCKFCDAAEICWPAKGTVPLPCQSCRTCCHATPETGEDMDGRWTCAKGFPMEQGDTCKAHLLIPDLVAWAEAIDAGADWIKFRDRDGGEEWVHGTKEWAVTTAKLIQRTPF